MEVGGVLGRYREKSEGGIRGCVGCCYPLIISKQFPLLLFNSLALLLIVLISLLYSLIPQVELEVIIQHSCISHSMHL